MWGCHRGICSQKIADSGDGELPTRNRHAESWLSQSLPRNRMAAGNLILSVSILITRMAYESIYEMAEVLRMPIMCDRHFYSIQESYLFPAIHSVYTQQKEHFIAVLGDNASWRWVMRIPGIFCQIRNL